MNPKSSILTFAIVYLLVAISHGQTEADWEAERQRHPALRLAQEGKFSEAWKYVERGEDKKGFYERGVAYYNYWSVRTTRRTPSGRPDPNSAVILNDINEDMIQANESLVRQYQAEAENGNPEAKAWLDKYAPRVKVGRAMQDSVNEYVKRSEQVGNPGAAPTDPESRYMITGVPDGDVLKIRSGPGMNYPVVCTVENGRDGVILTGNVSMNGGTDWYPVKIGEYSGWTRGKYLKKQ